MPEALRFQIIHGSAFRMREVGDASAALVLTSPPFFAPETEARMRAPVEQQVDFDGVSTAVTAFALALRPAFLEIGRVLVAGGHLVLETKDLRYARAFISLSCVHREMAKSAGLRLVSRILWQSTAESPKHGTVARATADLLGARGFRTVDTEEFLVFAKPGAAERLGERPSAVIEESEDLFSPVWHTAPTRSWHPHPSPAAVVRRFVQLFSRPGDLVVDPFAGSGTVLRVAAEMGRSTVGYEIDREAWARASGGEA